MRPVSSAIREIREESQSVRTLRLDRSFDPRPGQYMMVWIRGVDEIPMSFSGPGEITVHAVGEATHALFRSQIGESLGVRAPLGNGFQLVGDKILLIGGGVGVAPLAFLGETALAAGVEVTSLIGFRTAGEAIFRSRFERLGPMIMTSDDGSAGIPGRVAAGLKELDLADFSQIYLCGPELMMWDIICRAKGYESKIQACINRYFKCALGVCGSCSIDPEGIRVCVEGPVILADRLLEGEFGRYRRGSSGARETCGI
jgi:dihydroorotate dehydrogenase electron transfer subunit